MKKIKPENKVIADNESIEIDENVEPVNVELIVTENISNVVVEHNKQWRVKMGIQEE